MRVEAECYLVKRRTEDILMRTHSVSSGSWESVDFLGKRTKIALFCSLDKDKGSVLIKDPKKQIQVFRYEGPDDPEGQRMNTDLPIEIMGEQEVSIVTKRGKPIKEVLIFLNSENGEIYADSPFGTPDGVPIDSPKNPKVPVGVS